MLPGSLYWTQSGNGGGTPIEPIEIRFIRLDDDVCETLNRVARQQDERVSEIANRILREWLTQEPQRAEDRRQN